MEFRVLGPLQVVRDGEAVEPGSPKLRALLIDLLIHHGEVVSRDQLIEDLWAGSPPSTGLGVLQNYVSQLRKALGAEALATRGHGYALDVDPGALDSVRFEALVVGARSARAAGRLEAAADQLRDAQALWRGPALADVAGEPFAVPEITRLTELRASAAELEAGRAHAVLACVAARGGSREDAVTHIRAARAAGRDQLAAGAEAWLRDAEALVDPKEP